MLIKRILGYLGLLPFLISLAVITQQPDFSLIDGAESFIIYSIVIASFLSGVLWLPNQNCQRIDITSNVITVAAFSCFFFPTLLAAIALIIIYIALWRYERHLVASEQITRRESYLSLRTQLTFFVVTLHLVYIALLL
ncbi:DUF3429 domain-containing protein [Thalassotalea sp. LPB0316]|uniref:DUF3429 domain-containing protein n=1 Tax=Thalassotalea sp. LPB0316 TaxID=2769490 RepID=UPI001867C798|nr:DUF3429 domain-containing protein [Thalassotalea sp. LPB0316]QOL25130.1 DUF3429 domain-containing protein [Thalassotalea sp. LPB0316]